MKKNRNKKSARRTERLSFLPGVLCLFGFALNSGQGQEVRVLYDSNEQLKIAAKEAAAVKAAEELANDSPSVVVSLGDDEEDEESSAENAGAQGLAALVLSTTPTDAAEPEAEASLFSSDAASAPSTAEAEAASTSEDSVVKPESVSGQELDVLIDMRHAHDFSDFPLALDDRYYHRIYSYHRGFEMLRSRGYKVDKYESDSPLDAGTLSRCQTLFMNLPSADKAPFLVSEILAIRDFIYEGGSLVLITDHTNCYFHQSRLIPLFNELDIHSQQYGVCDAQHALGSTGVGWIYVNRFESSPVTRGLREIALQTGGGVDPRFAVAWSGDESWQDVPFVPVYGEADVGFFGNFERDPDEKVGASGVVLAKKFGRGKIVVIGDQNLFSAFFLQYLDVYRLWLNAFAWACDAPEPQYGAAASPEEERENTEASASGDPLYRAPVICWEDLRGVSGKFGDPDPNGYYHLYTALCRRFSPFCVAHDDPNLNPEVLLLLNGGADYQPESFAFASRQLQRGKRVVVVDPADEALTIPESEVSALLTELKEKKLISVAKANPDAGSGSTAESAGSTPQARQYVESFVLSNGGELVLVRGEASYRNADVPKPEGQVTLRDQQNLNRLLQCVDSDSSN